MTYIHYLGVDLGQSQDYSALALIQEPVWLDTQAAWSMGQQEGGWCWPASLTASQIEQARSSNYWAGRPANPPLAVPHLERIPLGTSYPAIVERVAQVLATPPLHPATTALVVDATGVGAPVVDLFRQAGLRPVPITITAGTTPSHDPEDGSHRVPKRDLVSTVAVLLERRRLKIAEQLAEAALLTRELQAFKRRVSPAASDSYGSWREKDHDDLVLALALACWYREWFNGLIELAHAQA